MFAWYLLNKREILHFFYFRLLPGVIYYLVWNHGGNQGVPLWSYEPTTSCVIRISETVSTISLRAPPTFFKPKTNREIHFELEHHRSFFLDIFPQIFVLPCVAQTNRLTFIEHEMYLWHPERGSKRPKEHTQNYKWGDTFLISS